jgi:hypothetical protein
MLARSFVATLLVVLGLGIVPAPAARRAPGVAVSAAVLESYVGRYEIVPGVEFDVALEDGRLAVQLTGQPRYPLTAESEKLFRYEVVDALIEFVREESGKVTGLVLHQNRTHQPARRVELSPARAAAPPPRAPGDAAARLAALERRLLEAVSVHVEAEIRSEGVLPSSLRGHLLVARDNKASLAFAGEFNRSPAQMVLVSDGARMRGGAPDLEFQLDTPAALNDGLVLGLTRMGLLHNLAVLSSGAPPDGTDGRAREWVSVRGVEWSDSGEMTERPAEVLRFEIVVAGALAGEARLWLDPDSGLPTLREQTVQFRDGKMRVTEQYRKFVLDAPAPAERFVLPHDHGGRPLDR